MAQTANHKGVFTLAATRVIHVNQIKPNAQLRVCFCNILSSNTLDLIITNEEGMADNIVLSAPVGKSHHLCITYDFMCYSELPMQDTPRFQYHKGHYENMPNNNQKRISISKYKMDKLIMCLYMRRHTYVCAHTSHVGKMKHCKTRRATIMSIKRHSVDVIIIYLFKFI